MTATAVTRDAPRLPAEELDRGSCAFTLRDRTMTVAREALIP